MNQINEIPQELADAIDDFYKSLDVALNNAEAIEGYIETMLEKAKAGEIKLHPEIKEAFENQVEEIQTSGAMDAVECFPAITNLIEDGVENPNLEL